MSNLTTPSGRPFVLVVALDLADTASGGFALDQALRIAARIPGSQLHAIHVTPSLVKRETLGLLRLYVSEKATAVGTTGLQGVGIHVKMGEPPREIAQLATDLSADLIIVGTHKRPHVNLTLGSTAERVMALATCPVVVAGPRPAPQPSHVIVIEGPCPECLQTRSETCGRALWCVRHSEHHAVLQHHHLYSYHSELPFAEHDSAVSSTGVD